MAQGQSNDNPAVERFGDYVVTRQLAVEQNAVIYRARKYDAPLSEKYEKHVIILCRIREAGVGAAADSTPDGAPLEKDLQLQFIEVVKQQKKANECGAPNLVPVRDFGLSPQGAWYATDYYPRGFLKKWVTQRAGVSEPELRHIVSATVRSLLELQQHCQRSHGNLNAASILIGGKIGAPLRVAPILLTYLKPGDAADADNYERADLRALGLIIYQLVCRQDTSSFNPDIYPILASEYWSQLGPEGEYWRGLCNRLLDPELTLEKVSLGKLAAELRPPVERFSPAIGLGAAAIIALSAAGLFYWILMKTPPKEPHRTLPPLEQAASTGTNEKATNPIHPVIQVETSTIPSVPVTNASATVTQITGQTAATGQIAYLPPALIGMSDRSVKLGTPAVQYPFQVGGTGKLPNRLFVVGVSSNPSFLPDSSLKIGGTGSERVLIIDPVPQQAGEVILAVSVTDGQTNVTQTFWFKVVP